MVLEKMEVIAMAFLLEFTIFPFSNQGANMYNIGVFEGKYETFKHYGKANFD